MNLDEVEFDDVEENGRYTSSRGTISDLIGATKLGYNLTVLPPGKVQCPFHSHHGEEEMFLILEGELMDSNGSLYKAGDFVSYPPGSHHNSWTGPGCVIMVVEWPSLAQQRAGRDASAQGGRNRIRFREEDVDDSRE